MNPFRWSHSVNFVETDLAGVVHFSNYYRWMEAAEHAFLNYCGISVAHSQFGWPRVHASADFKKPVRFGDQVEVLVEVEKLGEHSVAYRFEIHLDEGEEICAVGKMTTVCLCLKSGQKTLIPPEMRRLLE